MSGFATAADEVLQDLRARLGVRCWAVGRPDGPDYLLLASTGAGLDPGTTVRWTATLAARAASSGEPVAVPDVRAEASWAAAADRLGSGLCAYLSVPVVDPDGRELGRLSAWDDQPRPDLPAALPLAARYGRLLGTLLSHEERMRAATRRAERAEAVADLDPLTGAWSTWAWRAAMAGEDERAREHGGPLSVVLVAVAGADDEGAPAGSLEADRLLRSVAGTLRSRLRHGDLLARVGGAEFGVLLPETRLEAARALATDLRRSLELAGTPAAVGVASRAGAEPVAEVARRARGALHEDGRRATRALAGARAGAGAAVPPSGVAASGVAASGVAAAGRSGSGSPGGRAAGSDPAAGRVDALLAVARERLGMDVAFLSRFEGGDWVVRNAAHGSGRSVRPGLRLPRSRTYCDRMVRGELEHVVRDARRHPVVGPLAVTAELDIDTWMGVPVYRRDGRLYGTLCALAHSGGDPDRQLDLSLLEVLAVVVTDLVEAHDRHGGPEQEVLARLEAVRRRGGPTMVFQPVVSLADGTTVGHEALSRFPAGTPAPDRWFADAEAAGLGAELELSAVRNALERLDAVTGRLGINVSPEVLCSEPFARVLEDVPLDRLVLELTEHQVVHDYERVLAVLRPFRAAGAWLAVDDVGAGFSSLLHVLRMEPDLLKLDVGIVRQLDVDGRRRTLAQSLGRFAAENGAGVVAEGIETEAELACLRDIGITHGQGYLLGRPAPLPATCEPEVSTRRGA